MPKYCDVLKPQFGGLDIDETNVLSAVLARLSEISASRKDSADSLVTNRGRKTGSSGEGLCNVLCPGTGPYARDCRTRDHAKGSKRGP